MAKQDDVEEVRRKYPRAQMEWTAEEDEELIRERHRPLKELAERFQRQPGAIETRLKKLGKRGLIPPEAPVAAEVAVGAEAPSPDLGEPRIAPPSGGGFTARPEEIVPTQYVEPAVAPASERTTPPMTLEEQVAEEETEPIREGQRRSAVSIVVIILLVTVLTLLLFYLLGWFDVTEGTQGT